MAQTTETALNLLTPTRITDLTLYKSMYSSNVAPGQFWSGVSKAGLDWVFLLLAWLPNKTLRAQSALQFTHRLKENSWMHTFPKSIIYAIWDTNSLAHDLNSSNRVHFHWRIPLHHLRLYTKNVNMKQPLAGWRAV